MFGIKNIKEQIDLEKALERSKEMCKDLADERRQYKLQHELDIKRLEQEHGYAIKDLEKKIQYVETDEILALKKQVTNLEKEIAVVNERNIQLEKMTDLNADIIDVKDVMNKLIGKLPEINLSSLTVQSK